MRTSSAFISLVADRMAGKWIDCDDEETFHTEFESLCQKYGKGREYIVTDIEDLPSSVAECGPMTALWVGLVCERLSSMPLELIEHVRCQGGLFESHRWPRSESEADTFCQYVEDGCSFYEDAEDYARETYECCDIPSFLEPHIDWEAVARDLLSGSDRTEFDCPDGGIVLFDGAS